jgi:hypothetical protein
VADLREPPLGHPGRRRVRARHGAPDLGFPISAQIGVFAALAGAVAVAVGGLVDSGREVATVMFGPPAGRLAPGASPSDRAARVRRVGPGGGGRQAEVVDSTAEEVRS